MSFISASEEMPSFLDDINTLDKLNAILDLNILEQAFEYADVATVRRRRLPLEAVMWSVIGRCYRDRHLKGTDTLRNSTKV